MNLSELKKAVANYLAGKPTYKEKLMIDYWFEDAKKAAESDIDKGQYEGRKLIVLNNLRLTIHSGYLKKVSKSKILPFLKWSVAACIFTIAISTYLLRRDIINWVLPIKEYAIVTDAYEVKEVLLPDSSVVVLNTNSMLLYPSIFKEGREVILKGEAFFSIRKNPKQPFTVKGAHLSVKVLGTSFTVSDATKADTAAVAVKTGLVQVQAVHDKKIFPALSPRQQLNYAVSRNEGTVLNNVDVNTDWTLQVLVFRDTRLEDVFSSIEKVFDVKIISTKKEINQKIFTGSFVKGDSILKILDILSLSYGLKIKQTGKTVEIN